MILVLLRTAYRKSLSAMITELTLESIVKVSYCKLPESLPQL